MTLLDQYLALERVMVELDGVGDPLADRIRDLMDPIWYRLSPEEIALLDSRGHVDVAELFPVRLSAPEDPILGAPTISDKHFDELGWQAPVDDWKFAA